MGTVINILLLRCFEGQVQRFIPDCTLMRFGDYGNPPQLSIWFPQLVVWMCIVIVAKLMTLYLLLQFIQPLNFIVSHIFSVFHDKPQVELVLVMIIIPTIMNTVQFWVTDTFLKKREEDELADSELDEELISGVSSLCGDPHLELYLTSV
jgi:antibiotic biosynthesis monooxygenase (ABM) superfamily enzyme